MFEVEQLVIVHFDPTDVALHHEWRRGQHLRRPCRVGFGNLHLTGTHQHQNTLPVAILSFVQVVVDLNFVSTYCRNFSFVPVLVPLDVIVRLDYLSLPTHQVGSRLYYAFCRVKRFVYAHVAAQLFLPTPL